MKRRVLPLAVGVVALGGLWFAAMHRPDARATSVATAAAPKTTQDSSGEQPAASGLAAAKPPPRGTPHPPARSDVKARMHPPSAPVTDDYVAWERAQFTKYFTRLDERRARERRDPEFAAQVADEADRLLGEVPELADSKLVSLECGATICRVEAEHANPLAKAMYTNLFLLKMGKVLPEATLHTEPGMNKTVAHLAKRDMLPSFDELVEAQQDYVDPEDPEQGETR